MYADSAEYQADLIQEISYQLWRSFETYKGKSKRSTWIYRVALNTAITFLKKEKRRVDRDSIHPDVDIVYEQGESEKESRLAHFYRAVQELNSIEKALILLCIEGHSHKEIDDH